MCFQTPADCSRGCPGLAVRHEASGLKAALQKVLNNTERCAAPNGGPAPQLGDSGGMEGHREPGRWVLRAIRLMSYDLMLQTYPDHEMSAHEFDAVQDDLRHATNLQRFCEVAPGNLASDQVDVVVLGEGLDFGDFSERDFTEFCSSRGLPAERQHPGAAAAFVRSKLGFTVASFKMPTADADARTAYSEIVRFALRHKLRVTDPQKGNDVDLQKPGLLPPMWNP